MNDGKNIGGVLGLCSKSADLVPKVDIRLKGENSLAMGNAHRLVMESAPSLKDLHRLRSISLSTQVPTHLRSLVLWPTRHPEASLGAKCLRSFGTFHAEKKND